MQRRNRVGRNDVSISRQEHRIRVEPDVELFAVEKFIAPGARRAILLLPGAGVDHRPYDCPIDDYSLMDLLAGHGYRVFGVDFRGFGKSTKPADGSTVTAEICATDTVKVVDYIREVTGTQQVSLLGTSFGSIVATMVAEKAPTSVDRLVLIGFLYADMNPRVQAVLPPQAWEGIGRSPSGYMSSNPDMMRASLPCADTQIVDWNIAISSADVPSGPLLSVRGLPWVKNPEAITAPILIMNGVEDVFASEADSRSFLERVASTEKSLHLVPDSGHAPFMERNYRLVHQLLSEFLWPPA